MQCLNLGCGDRFHPDWTNLDVAGDDSRVRRWDLRGGIPFADSTFDVVYLSHVLEHFSRQDGLRLLQECSRVLRKQGTIRVVVPDLEVIARLYLETLEKSAGGDASSEGRYDWMMLELYDQTVRESSGGSMLEYVRSRSPTDLKFQEERLGGELARMLAASSSGKPSQKAAFRQRIKGAAHLLRRRALRLLAGREGVQALNLGRFRRSGEVHVWMYDRFSLGRALVQAGFAGPRVVGASVSRIPNWQNFHLDTEPDGTVYKPDSLFMEAVRL